MSLEHQKRGISVRIRLWLKVSMLAALAVVTSFVTSSVMARGKRLAAERRNCC